MKKVKSSVIGSIKPSSIMPRNSVSENKQKAAQEDEKDTSGQSSSRMSMAGQKKTGIGAGVSRPTNAPSRRSDSKESNKGTTPSASEDKRREQIAQKKAEEERKREEAKAKREELDRKKKEELDKKKAAEEERKRKLQEDRVAADRAKSQQ